MSRGMQPHNLPRIFKHLKIVNAKIGVNVVTAAPFECIDGVWLPLAIYTGDDSQFQAMCHLADRLDELYGAGVFTDERRQGRWGYLE